MSAKTWATVQQYAVHRGVTLKTIQRAIARGAIELTSRGVHVATADACWSPSPGRGRPPRSSADPDAVASEQLAGRLTETAPALPTPPALSQPAAHVEGHRPKSAEEKLLSDVQRAKLDAEMAKAKATVAELSRKAGELIDRDEARRILGEFAAGVRTRLERLPGRVQDQVAGQCRCRLCDGDVEVRDVSLALEQVIREELEALAADPLAAPEEVARRRRRR